MDPLIVGFVSGSVAMFCLNLEGIRKLFHFNYSFWGFRKRTDGSYDWADIIIINASRVILVGVVINIASRLT